MLCTNTSTYTKHNTYTVHKKCFIQQNKLMFLTVNMVSFDEQLWQVGIGVQKNVTGPYQVPCKTKYIRINSRQVVFRI